MEMHGATVKAVSRLFNDALLIIKLTRLMGNDKDLVAKDEWEKF
jgi:hypothetical protein